MRGGIKGVDEAGGLSRLQWPLRTFCNEAPFNQK